MILTCPSRISEHFAVVPPMSSASTFGSPMRRPSSAAPRNPLAGPDSTIVIGISLVFSTESTPQFDCMTYSGPPPACDLERVAEALGGDQARLDALALRERVDDDRGAVRHHRHLAGLEPALRDHVHDTALVV